MTTKHKKRINITADPEVEKALLAAARRDGLKVTTKAEELLRLALELEEDLVLGTVANSRAEEKGKFYSHEKVWK